MCFVCDRIKETRVGNNPFFVKELETGYVVIGDYQHFKGYTLFLYKTHVVELFDLDAEVRAKHYEEAVHGFFQTNVLPPDHILDIHIGSISFHVSEQNNKKDKN